MMEAFRNAWLGWLKFTEQGKLAALLLLAFLLFWFGGKGVEDERAKSREAENGQAKDGQAGVSCRTLIFYTTVMTICCICPLTAAALMAYQTKFYDYQWIWGAVPMTIVIALAGTQLWTAFAEKYAKEKRAARKITGITVIMLCVIYLCGSMQSHVWDADEAAQNREETAGVLEILAETGENKAVCLWAPWGIMEYARALDGSIALPYGRNMWDGALNAYSYDTYGEEEELLYEWMCHAEETGGGEVHATETAEAANTAGVTDTAKAADTVKVMETAKTLGVTHILLPGNLKQEVLAELEDYFGVQAENAAGYYLLCVG